MLHIISGCGKIGSEILILEVTQLAEARWSDERDIGA
jgi:hypothetical protein